MDYDLLVDESQSLDGSLPTYIPVIELRAGAGAPRYHGSVMRVHDMVVPFPRHWCQPHLECTTLVMLWCLVSYDMGAGSALD